MLHEDAAPVRLAAALGAGRCHAVRFRASQSSKAEFTHQCVSLRHLVQNAVLKGGRVPLLRRRGAQLPHSLLSQPLQLCDRHHAAAVSMRIEHVAVGTSDPGDEPESEAHYVVELHYFIPELWQQASVPWCSQQTW